MIAHVVLFVTTEISEALVRTLVVLLTDKWTDGWKCQPTHVPVLQLFHGTRVKFHGTPFLRLIAVLRFKI